MNKKAAPVKEVMTEQEQAQQRRRKLIESQEKLA
jgi:hypothetical protein